MPRISMQQAYDNRDVIAQIYKMMAEVADALEKATDAVSKALEAIEAAEDAGEAAEAAQQTADGKQDALTAEQLLAVNSGITAEGVTQIGTNATAIEGLDERTEILASTEDASAGDVLVLDENKDPTWGGMSWELVQRKTVTLSSHTKSSHGFQDVTYDAGFDYLVRCETEITATNYISLFPAIRPGIYWADMGYINNAASSKDVEIALYRKKGTGIVTVLPQNYTPFAIPSGNSEYYPKVNSQGRDIQFVNGLLPAKPTSADVGKAWVATSQNGANGAGAWREIIPAYSASDAGKVLSVNSSGELEWITLP